MSARRFTRDPRAPGEVVYLRFPQPRPSLMRPPSSAAELLALVRRRKGISLQEASDAIGLAGIGCLSRWERGLDPFPNRRRLALADLYGLDPALVADPSVEEVTHEEREFLMDLRRLDQDDRRAMRELMREVRS